MYKVLPGYIEWCTVPPFFGDVTEGSIVIAVENPERIINAYDKTGKTQTPAIWVTNGINQALVPKMYLESL